MLLMPMRYLLRAAAVGPGLSQRLQEHLRRLRAGYLPAAVYDKVRHALNAKPGCLLLIPADFARIAVAGQDTEGCLFIQADFPGSAGQDGAV